MQILIISAVFPPEPVVSAQISFEIAKAISEKKNVTVLSPKPTRPFGFKFKDYHSKYNFNHIQINSYTCPHFNLFGRLKESYSFGKHCCKYIIINQNDISLIYLNSWPLFAQYLTVKAAKKFNIPVIIHVQDLYPESFTNKLRFSKKIVVSLLLPIDKFIIRNATKIIAISNNMESYLIKTRNVKSEKIHIIQNWQDENTFLKFGINNKLDYKKNSCLTFMYLGNIGPAAGVDLIIKAFSKANLKKNKLIIAGSGSMKEKLVNYAKNFPDCSIEFWPVPEGKVPEIQSIADVLILPLKKGVASSSIPSKLPAYMFSAKPIIACVDEDSDTADAINNAKCGWVIGPENIEQLSLLMLEINSIPIENLKSLGVNGRDYALSNYSKKKNLGKMISIINETNCL